MKHQHVVTFKSSLVKFVQCGVQFVFMFLYKQIHHNIKVYHQEYTNRNEGGYVAKICVNGENNQTNQEFCCTSGGFDIGQTAQIKLPCVAIKLTLTAEEDVFIDSWSVVATEVYNSSKAEACYKMDGTTTNPKWHVENCTSSIY